MESGVKNSDNPATKKGRISRSTPLLIGLASLIFISCGQKKEHTVGAVTPEDSVAVMVSFGVNTLISDSGVIKYRIVTERWEVNQALNPSRWIFDKGVFMEQFDQKFHVQAYVQADTAYYFDQQKIWELRGRVRVRKADGLRFRSDELYWDQNSREFYSYKPSRVVTPEREMEGTYFRSDERMEHYVITNSAGSFVRTDTDAQTDADTAYIATDTLQPRPHKTATPKTR